MSDLAAALLRDVPRFNVTVGDHTDPSVLLLETEVLAALSAHLDGVTERAGEVLEGVTQPIILQRIGTGLYETQSNYRLAPLPDTPDPSAHVNETPKREHDAGNVLTDAAEAQNAALRAEADYASEEWIMHMKQAAKEQARAVKAEADLASLADLSRGHLETIVALRDALATTNEQLSKAEAEVEKLRGALAALEKAASEVSRRGAQTGPQWSKLTIALLSARAALTTEERHD